jgi:hypothetical protein
MNIENLSFDQYNVLCDIRFEIDQEDKVFTDDQLMFMIDNKEMIIECLLNLK